MVISGSGGVVKPDQKKLPCKNRYSTTRKPSRMP